MDNKIVTTLVKTFVELGCIAIRFNFRGVGESSGNFDEGKGEVEDVLAVVRYTESQFGKLPLILSGFSFGGYVQALVAERIHAEKLVLVAPAVGRFAMPLVPANTLLIHGEMDEVIPLSEILAWARQQHLHIVVVPDATHFFHGFLHQLKAIVTQHFMGYNL